MTGFAGFVGEKGSEIDPDIAAGMANAIARLGPDRQDSWRDGPAYLTHALLATTFEEIADRQPLTFDGEVHLVADARIDGRADLIRQLRAHGRAIGGDEPDSALILHAYHTWGETCVERLIGDFAFAIWDWRERRLFCARDQFGSVPFYFAHVGSGLAFANAVPALLAHPDVDRALNPTAIGDYLLFGYSQDPTAGFYRHIERLPPAHCLTFVDGDVRTRRYWSPPEASSEESEQSSADSIVEEFGAILASSVSDRLRTDRVATTLSGGMDSTLVTALAQRAGGQTRVESYSYGCDWLLPDTERYLAWRCAHHLGVPFHSISIEPIYLDPPGGRWRFPPEPRFELRKSAFDLLAERLVSAGTRVVLLGMGGDVIAANGLTHWGGLIRERRLGRLMQEAARYWRYHRRRPPLRGAWQRAHPRPVPPVLASLNPDFGREHALEARWRDAQVAGARDPRVGMTAIPFWSEMFVAFHPESTGRPIRARQPFFDVRLLEAAMRLPPTPWQFNKAILRQIGKQILPPEILKRPKTAFGRSTAWEAARRGLEPWLVTLGEATELDGFVDRVRLRQSVRDINSLPSHFYQGAIMLPASLATWLRSHDRMPGERDL